MKSRRVFLGCLACVSVGMACSLAGASQTAAARNRLALWVSSQVRGGTPYVRVYVNGRLRASGYLQYHKAFPPMLVKRGARVAVYASCWRSRARIRFRARNKPERVSVYNTGRRVRLRRS